MNEKLDNDLKKKIRELFETYESAGADEGWLLLRKKFPEEKRNRKAIIWFWSGVAAILLLFLGFGLWDLNKKIQPENFASEKSKPADKTNSAIIVNIQPNNNKAKLNKRNSEKTEENNPLSVPDVGTHSVLSKSLSVGTHSITTRSLSKTKSTDKIKTINKIHEQNHTSNGPVLLASKNSKSKKSFKLPITDSGTSSDTDTADNKIADNKIKGENPATNGKPGIPAVKVEKEAPKQPSKSINTMFAEDIKKKVQKSIEKNKKIRFGIYEATYFNYAKGSSNNVNIGAGLTANINVGKNLELVAGLAIGQNTLSFDNDIPAASQTYLTATGSTFATSVSHSATALPLSNFSPATTVKNYSAGLVGLDIPLNLKYALNSSKSSIYFSAGFSSGTFISETYNYQYYYSASSSPYLQQTQQQATNKNFNSFYFAKMLNLSIGESLPFGKNRLIIEPFLKYPLGGLGSQDIHFGAGGINLKFNLQNSKK